MNALTFDKLVYVDRLKAAGFTEEQARGQAAALDTALHETVATKADVEDIKSEFKSIRAEMRELEARLTIRLGGMIAGSVVIVAALVKLL